MLLQLVRIYKVKYNDLYRQKIREPIGNRFSYFFDEFIFVTIYVIYIGEGEGGLTVGICQADVMKKSNHFIVTANYYGFII